MLIIKTQEQIKQNTCVNIRPVLSFLLFLNFKTRVDHTGEKMDPEATKVKDDSPTVEKMLMMFAEQQKIQNAQLMMVQQQNAQLIAQLSLSQKTGDQDDSSTSTDLEPATLEKRLHLDDEWEEAMSFLIASPWNMWAEKRDEKKLKESLPHNIEPSKLSQRWTKELDKKSNAGNKKRFTMLKAQMELQAQVSSTMIEFAENLGDTELPKDARRSLTKMWNLLSWQQSMTAEKARNTVQSAAGITQTDQEIYDNLLTDDDNAALDQAKQLIFLEMIAKNKGNGSNNRFSGNGRQRNGGRGGRNNNSHRGRQ